MSFAFLPFFLVHAFLQISVYHSLVYFFSLAPKSRLPAGDLTHTTLPYPIYGDVLVWPGLRPGPGPTGQVKGGNVLEAVDGEGGPTAQDVEPVLVAAHLVTVPGKRTW